MAVALGLDYPWSGLGVVPLAAVIPTVRYDRFLVGASVVMAGAVFGGLLQHWLAIPWHVAVVASAVVVSAVSPHHRATLRAWFTTPAGIPLADGVLASALVIGSAMALLLYETLGARTLMLVPTHTALVVAGGLVANATIEEVVWRGYLMEGARHGQQVVPLSVVSIQAVSFGFAHMHGYPSGLVGVALATVFGFGAGLLRVRTSSLMLAIGVHLAADFAILWVLA